MLDANHPRYNEICESMISLQSEYEKSLSIVREFNRLNLEKFLFLRCSLIKLFCTKNSPDSIYELASLLKESYTELYGIDSNTIQEDIENFLKTNYTKTVVTWTNL